MGDRGESVVIEFNFTVDGEQQLRRWLDIASDSVNDFTPIFEKLADDFRQTQEEVFKKEGANEGLPKWKPLSPRYKKWKTKYYPGRPILVLKGDLKRSLINKSDSKHIERIKKDSFEIGTKVNYAIFHQRGTNKMPKRKVLDLSEPQKRRWIQIAHRELFNLMSSVERQAHQRGTVIGRR